MADEKTYESASRLEKSDTDATQSVISPSGLVGIARPPGFPNPVVHIAGEPIRCGTIGRQLCAFCGEKLYDKDLRSLSVMQTPGSRGPTELGFFPFATGAFVEKHANGVSVVSLPEGHRLGPIPSGFCGEMTGEAVKSGGPRGAVNEFKTPLPDAT
jgi:hypothetical protein